MAEEIQTGTDRLYDQAVAQMESGVLTRVMNLNRGNQMEAARILGIARTTLRTKIRQAGIALELLIR